MSNLHLLDLIVIASYFLVLLGIGYWAARREKNVSADYFLASRDVGWLAVGASLFASNIGSEHLVGLAGTGAASGMAVGHFEWLACFMLLLLGWLFVPFYIRSGVYTMPEFLERRFNSAARWYFSGVSVIGYVLTKISVTLFAGGVVMHAVTGLDLYTSAAILIVITGLYTIFGGLRAVIYTEVMQAVVLIAGSGALAYLGLGAIGGWSGLHTRLPVGLLFHVETREPSRLSVDRRRVRSSDSRRVVLVHGSTHRAARAGRQERDGGAAGNRLCRIPQDPSRFHLRAAGHDRGCALSGRSYGRRGLGVSRARYQTASVGLQGSRARGNAGGAHELSGVGVQLVFDAAHVGRLPKAAP